MSLIYTLDKPQIVEMKLDSLDLQMKDNMRNSHISDVEGTQMRMLEIFEKLKKQYKWFKTTQWGDIDSYGRDDLDISHGFRWRGRKGIHTLTSGLDDYPRSDAPHPGELHVDLMSWMGLYSKSLAKFASMLNIPSEEEKFKKEHEDILNALNLLHWDESSGVFCDLSVDENGILSS
jgi:mannosyl-oligosaccharide glucosidase